MLSKVADEILHGSGIGITPEPEELLGITTNRPDVHPTHNIVCIKPVRRSRPNPSFHRYSAELWSIEAMRSSKCPMCGKPIMPGEEITLFDGVPNWSHFSHAIDGR